MAMTEKFRPEELEGKPAARILGTNYRTFFENSADAMFISDLSGVILDANAAAERLTGYTLQELREMPIADRYAPEHVDMIRTVMRDKVESGVATTRYEVELVTKSGERLPVETVSSVVRENGKPVAIYATLRDITDRKRLEESLRQQAAVMAQVNAAIIGICEDGHICDWNPQAEALLGWTAQDVVGRMKAPRLVAPEEQERFALVSEMIARGQRWQGDMMLVRRTGAPVPCHVSVGPSRDGQGNINGSLMVCVDNTRERRVEEAMRQSQRFAQAVLDTLHRQVAILDDEGIIIQVNDRWRSFADTAGLPMPEYGVGTSYLEVCDRAAVAGCRDAAEMAAGIRAVLADERERYLQEYRCEAPGGTRWFEAFVERTDWNGPLRLVVGHADITRRMEAQHQALRAQRRMLKVFNLSPDAIVVEDANCNIEWFSRAAEEMFGCAAHEVVGRSMLRLIPERLHETHQRFVETFATNEEEMFRRIGRKEGITLSRFDGTEFQAELTAAKLEEDGEVTFVGILRKRPGE